MPKCVIWILTKLHRGGICGSHVSNQQNAMLSIMKAALTSNSIVDGFLGLLNTKLELLLVLSQLVSTVII